MPPVDDRRLPPPLTGQDPSSFAHYTVTQRFPAIAKRVSRHPFWSQETANRLETLATEIPASPIRLLDDNHAPDAEAWSQILSPYLGWNWLDPPWLVVEFYFYRRLLEATGYFMDGPTRGRDPFSPDKEQALQDGLAAIPKQLQPDLNTRLLATLWGNQTDLSMWTPGSNPHDVRSAQQDALIIDDRIVVLEYLEAHPSMRLDVIADNAGPELLADLLLIDALFATFSPEKVVLHLKPHPTFVSDATIDDVEETWQQMATHPALSPVAERLGNQQSKGALVLRDHAAWVWPLPFDALPGDLHTELEQSDLVIIKGDCNYRRLLGDRAWDYTTPFRVAAGGFPAPLVAIRTFKAEVAAGLSPHQVQLLDRSDSDWIVNGKRGVIQSAL